MPTLQEILASLPLRHREALSWFESHRGTRQDWPDEIAAAGESTLLATKAKGIYKPGWSKYALSIRQTLGGPYPDEDPLTRADGTWSYKYFQENPDPSKRDDEFTNLGLMACLRDGVPVGVMRQAAGKPHVQYDVLGLALVAGWDDGFFFFEGFGPTGLAHGKGPAAELEAFALKETKAATESGVFDPKSVIDGRVRVLASIVRRRGQPAFRDALIAAYSGKCAISGCDAVQALEAAHITPYKGPETNHPVNGLLFRADLHTHFDVGFLAVHEETRQVLLSPTLLNSSYSEFAGRIVNAPNPSSLAPSPDALRQHRLWAGM